MLNGYKAAMMDWEAAGWVRRNPARVGEGWGRRGMIGKSGRTYWHNCQAIKGKRLPDAQPALPRGGTDLPGLLHPCGSFLPLFPCGQLCAPGIGSRPLRGRCNSLHLPATVAFGYGGRITVE